MLLVTEVYRNTQAFPRGEIYGLTAQTTCSGISAQQYRRGARSFFDRRIQQFLGHARGSLLELETQILIAQNLGYLSSEESELLLSRSEEVGRILGGLMKSLPVHK